MSNSPSPSDKNISDAVWEQYGAAGPRHETLLPSDGSGSPAPGSDGRTRARRVAGYLVLAAAVGCVSFWMLADRVAASPEWLIEIFCALAAGGGATGGLLLWPRRRLAGLLAGAFLAAGSVGATALVPQPAGLAAPVLALGVGVASLVLAFGAYHVLKFLQNRGTVVRRRSQLIPTARPGPPMYIFYEPLPEPAGPQEARVAERLLFLCKEDQHLFQRLLNYERGRQPHLRRVELLRLAIEHFKRDNE